MKDYFRGDTTVHDALEVLLNFFENPVTVVRNVDGSRSLDELSRIFKHHKIDYHIVNGNLCLFREELTKAVEERVFTGFDEVWIFSGQPPKTSLVGVPYSTGDALFNKKGVDQNVRSEFKNTGCLLLLADGVELHYLTEDQDIISVISEIQ